MIQKSPRPVIGREPDFAQKPRFTTCYCILTYALPITGKTGINLLELHYWFGLRLRSDIRTACTGVGLALSPIRCEVPYRRTVSIAVFRSGYFIDSFSIGGRQFKSNRNCAQNHKKIILRIIRKHAVPVHVEIFC